MIVPEKTAKCANAAIGKSQFSKLTTGWRGNLWARGRGSLPGHLATEAQRVTGCHSYDARHARTLTPGP